MEPIVWDNTRQAQRKIWAQLQPLCRALPYHYVWDQEEGVLAFSFYVYDWYDVMLHNGDTFDLREILDNRPRG